MALQAIVPWIPSIVAGAGALFAGLKGRGEAKTQPRSMDRDWAIRKALADYYLDRKGLRTRLPPALLAALMQAPERGRVPGLSGTLLQALLSGARYAPGLSKVGSLPGPNPAVAGIDWTKIPGLTG